MPPRTWRAALGGARTLDGAAGGGDGRACASAKRSAEEAEIKAEAKWSGNPIGIVGGGLSGLACGWALKRRGVRAVVFDTGKRGPGGRASSRILPQANGSQHIVDHAVQAFTVGSHPEVRQLVEEMERAGAAQRWRGRLGTLSCRGFAERDGAAPLWVGSPREGMGSVVTWLARDQEVLRDVWVAKLAYAADGDWALLDTRGRTIGDAHSFSYVVMAHNGKCADRLVNTAPLKSVAHAPLRCKFTSEASPSSDRLELSSLWVCVVEIPSGAVDFDGAFIEGDDVLSWAGNNSSKYPQGTAAVAGKDAWTLISTPQYGSANKCPQEAIPEAVRRKVCSGMLGAFAALLGRSSPGWKVLHLQLWGAALPLNVCDQRFIHDPEARIGVCGDWLTAPSVEGAIYSGLALGGAIGRHFCDGGLPSTGVQRFLGKVGCHAIGDFGQSSAGAALGDGAGSPRPKQKLSRWERPQKGGRAPDGDAPDEAQGRRRGRWAASEEAPRGEVWNFAFGANINPVKLQEKRKIIPAEQVAGVLHGWRLVFNHKGGMGNIERLQGTDPPEGPEAVHGMLLHLSARDFDKLSQMEHEYTTAEVEVKAYDGRTIAARAFVTPPQWRLPTYPAPPERYLNLIKEGAASSELDGDYVKWLNTLPSIKGQRGAEYWAAPANEQQQQQQKPKGAAAPTHEESHLRLAACKAFAINGAEALVDIGANMGKCKPQDLGEQLARSAAAGVNWLILTGCSVRSSRDAQRICGQWSGAEGLRMAEKHVGKGAWNEFLAAGLSSLPSLVFTAGVHPHDAKTCDDRTVATLQQMAADRRCVAIGECGLDYDRMFSPQDVQLKWCRQQVRLAIQLDMPLFLHERDRDASKGPPLGSARELMAILQEEGVRPERVCVHCYTGNASDLKAYVQNGFFIGLTGFVGMKKRGAHIRDLLAKGAIPLAQLMIETDCPFMMPDKDCVPAELGLQGRRMEPCALPAVCRSIAELLGQPPSAVASATTRNAERFFGLAAATA